MSRKVFVVALVALCILATNGLQAGESDDSMYVHVTSYKVNPADSDEWVQLGKDWVTAFADANMDESWDWYMSSNGFEYVIVDMHKDMASFDHGEEMQAKMVEAIGEETMAALRESSSSIDFEVVSSEVVKVRSDLSYHAGEMDGPPGFIHIGVHSVKPGMAKRFEGALGKVAEAWKQTETPGHWTTHEVTLGQGSYVVVSMAASPVAFYQEKTTPQVLTEAFGEEETKALYTEWRDCISDYTTQTMYPRPELSYVAKMYASDDSEGEGEAEGDS